MSYPTLGMQNQASTAYVGGQDERPEGELEAIVSRLQRMSAEMNEVGHKLGIHADNVFGPRLTDAAGSSTVPVRSGLIGSIHDALDQLASAHSFVASEAGRNCTLA